MKINKRLIIAGNEVLLVKEDINLALNWAGKASFIIGSDEELKGLVKYQIGIGYRLKEVKLKIKTGPSTTQFKGDIN